MLDALKKKTGPSTLLLLVVYIFFFIQKVSCDGVIQMRLISFTNPGGKGFYGHCCDGNWSFCESGGGCDHFFIVCLDQASRIQSDNMDLCKFGKKRTATTHNKANVNFGSRIGGSTPNPFSFNFTSWPGSVVVKVEAWDDDGRGNKDDYVGLLRSAQPLTMSAAKVTDLSAQWTTTTLQQRISMRMEMRVLCGVNWYGVECNVFCEPKDGPSAFYSCSNDGQKICGNGWTSQNCDVNIDDCFSAPCQNDGQCTDGINSYSCSCLPGYTGVDCETDIDDCAAVDCHTGTCVDGINRYTCQCQPGYTGETCLEMEFCLDNPCLNNGTCQTMENGFNCTCTQGWTGSRCEVDVDECSSHLCRNLLDCENTDGGFVCTCLPGWTGRLCDENVDECQSQPCANGGTCIDGNASYTCRCTDEWTPASSCLVSSSMSTLPLQPTTTVCQREDGGNVCQNNGTCVEGQTGNFARCECAFGWTGERCQDALSSACSSADVCNSHGLCFTSPTTSDQFLCQCFLGYYGQFCEVNSDDYDDDDDDVQDKQKITEEEEEASAWTFRGLLKEEDIATLQDLIVNVTSAADDDSLHVDRQSTEDWDETSKTNDVDVWVKVDHCDSQSPEKARSIVLFRVTKGGKPIPRQDVDRILGNLTDDDLRFQPSLSFLSTERQCTRTIHAAQKSSEAKFAHHRGPVIAGVILFAVIVGVLVIGAYIVLKRRQRQRRENETGITNPNFNPLGADGRGSGADGGRGGERTAEWYSETSGVRCTFNRDSQRTGCNLYMSSNYNPGRVADEDQHDTITCHP